MIEEKGVAEMNTTIQTIQPTKSKKAAEPQRLNAESCETTGKRTNFQMVAAGVCLHDNALLLEPEGLIQHFQ